MTPDAVGPDQPAPLRGFRTAGGLFVQCSGPDTQAASELARLLATLPESPVVRGVIVQVPAPHLGEAQGRNFASATRGILRVWADLTPTRCPVYVVVTGMEDVPGFLEFARRSPREYQTSARFGFSLPGERDPSSTALAREYDRLLAWCQPAILDMMEAAPLAQEGNEALFRLGRWFRRAREPVCQLLGTLPTGGDDPLDLLNCYFAATGPTADRRAFAEGVLRGKLAGDPRSVRWSSRTLAVDRRLGRAAVGLGALGGLGAAVAWVLIFQQLRPTGWSEILLALGIAAAWLATWYELLRGFRRPGSRPQSR